MRIAILGAGFQGVCTAAALADYGHTTELFDSQSEPLTRAGSNNEGKIHLGLVYANDETYRTAEGLMSGGLRFMDILSRWLDPTPDVFRTSSPFYYGVHNQSIIPPEYIRTYFKDLNNLYRKASGSLQFKYMDSNDDIFFEDVSANELSGIFNPDIVNTAFRTMERAVDTTRLAQHLRLFVAANPYIHFHGDSTILGVEQGKGNKLSVLYRDCDKTRRASYDCVINTLWSGRLAIDDKMGLVPKRPWLYRYKLGIELETQAAVPSIPSITLVHGPYGDIVNYDDRRFYLSWYPAGMIARSGDIEPPDCEKSLSAEHKEHIYKETFRNLCDTCPPLAGLDDSNIDSITYKGGIIFAWGKTDIDDMNSELHYRYDIGIHSHGNYHSIDTGKFTMAPYYALKLCDRILGQN